MWLEIKGVHFENQGAHLMACAVRDRLRALRPEVGIVLAAGPNSSPEQVARFGAARRLGLRRRWIDLNALSYSWPAWISFGLERRGRVPEGRLGGVLDASGFAYGDDWTPWLMAYAADEVTRLAVHGRPYVFLPQAFGPFRPGKVARNFGRSLERAALVCPRDERSEQYLLELNPRLRHRLLRCPDLTIGYPGDASAARAWNVDRSTVLVVPNVQMADRSNPDRAWRDGYVAFLVTLVRRLQSSGHRVLLLNHEGRADAALCLRIAADAGGVGVVTEPDPRAVKGVIGAAGAVVSSRFHGCVAALSQGVPCLGTSWSHKYRELFREFGAEECLLGECDAAAAAVLVDALLMRKAIDPVALRSRAATVAVRVDEMWGRVAAILDSVASSRGGRR